MPIFDFKCTKCKSIIKDEIVSHKELNGGKRIIRECPKCGEDAERMIGSPMFYFRRPGSN